MDGRVSLTGRIAITAGRRTVDERALPGRQPRLVFALLVLERRALIQRDVLVENLWPQGPPETWDAALRGIVTRVRRCFTAAGLDDDLLRAEVGGYRLCLPQGITVDVERASEHAGLAERALAADNPGRAAEHAARARGVLVQPFLPGVEAPWVGARRTELSRLLREVLEVLAEARLGLGEHQHAATAAQDAVTLDPFRESAHRLLIRALAAGGNAGAGLQAYERCRSLLADELGIDPAPETQALHLEILRAAPSATVEPLPRSTSSAVGRCPYLGLQTFDAGDADLFFGRSADVSRLLDRLCDTCFLAVLGPSGSGKSSLVRAGLIPALRRGAMPGSDTWAVSVLRPGAAPVKALVRELSDLLPDFDHEEVAERLVRDPLALHETVEAALDAGLEAERVVFVVDQLEEAFTLCADDHERRAFVNALCAAADAPRGRTVVVTTLRADFYHRLAEHPDLADLASTHQFLVTPMDEVGLAEAVQGPARVVGVALEPGLTETFLRDVARQPGSLPLLGHALLELWDRRRDATLTLEAYGATGGVEGALAQRAEAVYAGLCGDDQRVARRVLLRLAQPGEGTADTRRRVGYAELPTRREEGEAVERVVGTLAAARLLTVGGPPEGERWVEVSHEALIHGWPRLRAWVEEGRAGLLVHRRLTGAAAEWDRLGHDDGALYRGAHLAEALAWSERDPEAANPLERAFLAASVEAQEAERHRRLRRLRLTAASLAVGLLVVAGLSVVALGQARVAAAEARAATARELAAAALANLDVDPERSILLALAAVDLTAPDGAALREAEEALHRAVRASRVVYSVPQGHAAVAVSPDGGRFATTGRDGTATVWEIATGEELMVLGDHDGPVSGVAFGPDGGLLATAGEDGTARVWDADGELRSVLRGHHGDVNRLAFSPDGSRLATAGQDGTVRLWDPATGVEGAQFTEHERSATAAVFSPDGARLASAGVDGRVKIWDLATGESAVDIALEFWAHDVAFSPDGSRVAAADAEGIARVWDAESGELLVATFRQPGLMFGVAFSPDGERFATGASDGTARVWDAQTGETLLLLAGHAGVVTQVAFTPEGNALLTTSGDGTTRLWDVSVSGSRDWVTVPGPKLRWVGVAFSPDGTRFAVPGDPSGVTLHDTATGAVTRTLEDHDAAIVHMTFSPDGSRLAAAAGSGLFPDPANHTVAVWDVDTGELLLTLTGHEAEVGAVAFSRDGDRVVTGGFDGTVRLWNAVTGRHQGTIEQDASWAATIALSPDGRLVATEEGSGSVTLWDAHTLDRLRTHEAHAGDVNAIAFGPDGWYITGGDDGLAKVWDVESAAELVTLAGHTGVVHGLAVSADGRRIATGGGEGTAKLWDPDGRELLTLYAHDLPAYGVAFSPDGRLLATSSPDGTVALHLLPVEELVELARGRLTRGATAEECRQYPQLPGCEASGR